MQAICSIVVMILALTTPEQHETPRRRHAGDRSFRSPAQRQRLAQAAAVAEVAAVPAPIVLPTREPGPEPEPAPVPVPVRMVEAEDEDEEEPVVVKSLQPVSAIDLVMEEEEPKGSA